MYRRLPPFAGLCAFEAGARHMNFRRAAEELCVTQSAVSHQIKRLERYLGIPLFERRRGNIELTAEGRRYMSEVGEVLDRLAAATARIRVSSGPATVTVSLLHSFATRWLIPRLPEFQKAHSHIEIRLSASSALVDLQHSDIDVAIRYGTGDWPGLHCELLMSEDVFPVCSPALIAGRTPLRTPSDLLDYRLICNQSHPGEWQQWLSAAGVASPDGFRQGPSLASSDLSLRAAAEGMGIALGRRPLVDEDLEAGRLVAPVDIRITSGNRYFLVCLPEKAGQPNIELFRNWLQAAAARDRDRDR